MRQAGGLPTFAAKCRRWGVMLRVRMPTLLLDICWVEVTQGYFREMWVQGLLQLCHTGHCLHPTCVCVS